MKTDLASSTFRFVLFGALLLFTDSSISLAAQDTPPASITAGSNFKISTTLVAGGQELAYEIFFHGYRAVEFEDDGRSPAVVYHLARPMWQDHGTNDPVTLEDADRLSKEIANHSRAAVKEASERPGAKPGPQRALLESMIEPAFTTSQEGSTLIVSNEVMRYVVKGTTNVAPDVLERVFQYDRLNAYRKAVTEQKAPPYAQLALDRELETRKLLPANISMTLAVPGRRIEVEIRNRLEPLSDTEAARVAKALARPSSR